MKILGYTIIEEKSNNSTTWIIDNLFGEKFKKGFPENPLKRKNFKIMENRAKQIIQRQIFNHIYEQDKDKKNGKYYVVAPMFSKEAKLKYHNIISCVFASSTYRKENVKVFTDNNLVLSLLK